MNIKLYNMKDFSFFLSSYKDYHLYRCISKMNNLMNSIIKINCFFLYLFIKVSNGRPYSYTFVSFSLSLSFSVEDGRSHCYSSVSLSFFFLLILCRGFLDPIFSKISGLIQHILRFIQTSIFGRSHFWSSNMVDFRLFKRFLSANFLKI